MDTSDLPDYTPIFKSTVLLCIMHVHIPQFISNVLSVKVSYMPATV